jgi:hypothetical protein
MKPNVRIALLGLFLTIYTVVPINAPARGQTSTIRYTYITQTTDMFPAPTITITAVNPSNLGDAVTLFTVPAPKVASYFIPFRRAIPSPDGQWIALIFWAAGGGWSASQIVVVNVSTGEIHQVNPFPVLLYDNDLSTLENVKMAVWSPNSRNLAFIMELSDGDIVKGDPDMGELDVSKLSNAVFIYSVQTQNLIKLTEANSLHGWSSWYVWSNDSTRLAIANQTSVDGSTEFEIALGVYEVSNQKQQISIIAPKTSEWLSLPTALCFLAWSPDGTYLSFVMDCDYSSSRYKEVYLAEIASGKISQLTNFFNKLGVPGSDGASSYPEPIWYDAHTLLIGTGMYRGTGAIVNYEETLAFHFPEKNSVKVSQEWATTWALNPISGDLAYLVETLSTDKSLINGNMEIEGLRISSFDGQTLTPIINLPATWGYLEWSPDGLFLAYTASSSIPVTYQTEQGPAIYNLWSTTFIDKSSGRLTQYTPPADRHTRTYVGGWVLVPNK